MSYCRFIEADVYAYETKDAWDIWVTANSELPHAGEYFKEPTIQDFQARMIALRDLGYDIPDYVFEQIAEEVAEVVRP